MRRVGSVRARAIEDNGLYPRRAWLGRPGEHPPHDLVPWSVGELSRRTAG